MLGRDYDVPSILRRAFYEVSRAIDYDEKTETDIDGDSALDSDEDPSDDGHDDSPAIEEIAGELKVEELAEEEFEEEVEEEEPLRNHTDEYGIDQLDPSDLIVLLHAQKYLMSSWTSALIFGPLKCKTSCKGSRATKGLFQPTTSDGAEHIIQLYQSDPVCGINKLMEEDWQGKWGYCAECAQLRTAELESKKQELWKDLNDWFA